MSDKFRYKITVEPIGKGAESEGPISLEIENHDNIIAIVKHLQARTDIQDGSEESLAVGLKLFSNVLLTHKDNPLFEPLVPHFKAFMQRLKK